jgi:hypothetical protein
LPEDGLNNLIDQLQSAGQKESSGVFTMSAEKAKEKLGQFQLAEPPLYVQNIVACAVVGGASRLEVKLARSGAALGFDGQTYNSEQLSGLLAQLLTPTSPALQELAVALNTLRALERVTVVFYSISADGTGAKITASGERIQVDEFVADPGSGSGNLLQVSQSFQGTSFLSGFWSPYREQIALESTCYHAPLDLSVNGKNLQKPIQIGTASPDCLAWLEHNPPQGAAPIEPPDSQWSANCEHFQIRTAPAEFGCVLALDRPEVARGNGLFAMCNGVLFRRQLSALDVPFVHGLIWGPLDKNVSHSDLSENASYWRLITWAQTTAEWLVVQRMRSPTPIPESDIKKWLNWAPILIERLERREESEMAEAVRRWVKESRSVLDLKNESYWTELVGALNQITDPDELTANRQRIGKKLHRALEMSLQSALYLDCELLCQRLESLDPAHETSKNLLAAASAVCGREPGDLKELDVEVQAHILRLNGRSTEAAVLPVSEKTKGLVALALESFDEADQHLAKGDLQEPTVLEAMSDSLAYSPNRSKKSGHRALDLREMALEIRESSGAPWGGLLRYDVARLARSVANFREWISHRARASLSGSITSEVGRKLEADLLKAIDGLNRGPTALVQIHSSLLYAEKSFPLDHVFLTAVRSKAVHALRRSHHWQEADSVLARESLLNFLLENAREIYQASFGPDRSVSSFEPFELECKQDNSEI